MMNQPTNDANYRLPNGSTVLHNAARIGNVNNVRLLLSQGADVNALDAQGKKPIDYTSKPEIKEILTDSANARLALPEFKAEQKLAEMKKNIKNEDDKNKIINGLIMNPEFYSDIDDATREKLIEKLFNYNINDNTPVIAPVAAPITTTTSTAIAAEDDVRTPIPAKHDTLIEQFEDNRKPLGIAASTGNTDIVKELIEQGATINEKDGHGNTALFYASTKEIAKILLDKGADFNNVTNNCGHTPLHYAAGTGNKELLNFLLEKGMNVNITNEHGLTPLHCAAFSKEFAIIKFLLQSGSEIDLVDSVGATPFFYLTRNHQPEENKELIEFFLNNKVNLNVKIDITIPTIGGESIFNHALQSKDKWLLEKLISKGVNIGEGVLLRNPFDHSINELVKIGVDKETIVYALKKYNSHIDEQIKINTIQKYLGEKSARDYKNVDVNDYNYDAPTQEELTKNTNEKLLKDITQRLQNGEDKDGIINTLIEISINENTRAELIEKVLNYNVNDNNPVATPALVTPVATPTVVPAPSTSISEGALSADIKVRLYNGESKEDLINFVFLYQGISDEARDNLVNEICDYSFGTALAGQIATDIQF
ncbi:MAG TPA: ankyrin repeat domain-containing protein [Rickettsia endosymbiont of Omalisus fontisbellaquei]|nr:ankyrin repeat domain-containing protein [Rickettsia endosymbiont of Omalisus fontisbellaquei]